MDTVMAFHRYSPWRFRQRGLTTEAISRTPEQLCHNRLHSIAEGHICPLFSHQC
jgi:hypothetical protein